jgi:DUF971 family protein
MPYANSGAEAWPTEIRLNPARDTLTVAFDDGARFDLRAELLRVESPSAEVRNHGGPKTIVLGKKDVTIAELEPVGNYAVRISFSDGHDTGLYSWPYLHQLGAEKDRIWAEYLAASQK